jgi:ribulose-phosphate 3-epimerase
MLSRSPRAVRLAPSVLAADFGRLAEQIAELDRAADVDRLHVDVMDGVFVPNISFGQMIVQVIRRNTRLPLDVHLMIVDPGRYLASFVDSGANGLIVHVETCPHLERDLAEIRRLGARAGVAINPGTTPVLIDSVLDVLDEVLVMTVNPGFGGQRFLPGMIPKIRRVRTMLDAVGSRADLAVDGGIAAATTRAAVQAGADVLVAGSAVFGHPKGVGAALGELSQAAHEVTGDG